MTDRSVGYFARIKNYLSGIPNPSAFYRKEGYLIDEMGPAIFEGKGKMAIHEEAAQLVEIGSMMKDKPLGRCPMAFS
jgi:hypothetical protein